ncbi:MAG: endonuclease [Muribaculaceae bacterium]
MRKIILLLIISLCLQLSAKEPEGYYRLANGKKSIELKTALHKIIAKANMLEYGSGKGHTWEGFHYTDCDGTTNKVIDMYSNKTFYQTDFNSVVGMHIEHSLPKSWWGTIVNNAYKDLHHLYPAEGNINTRKNNLPLGETGEGAYTNGVSFTGANKFEAEYTGNCFEPADEYKGDFARSYLYVSTAYEELYDKWDSPMMDNNTYPVWEKWAIDLLLKWHRQDPVSQKELTRTEKVFAIQGNRNPFIDYPELVEYIWGRNTDKPFSFPMGNEPYLTSPSGWDIIDFDVVMTGSNLKQSVLINGANIKIPLKAKLTGRYPDMVSINATSFNADDVNRGTSVDVNLFAKTKCAINDTLKLYSAEIDTIFVPISAITSTDFLGLNPSKIDATTALLHWMKIPDAQKYTTTVYEGKAPTSGDLFVSVYLEGSSNNKALEIFNATGKSIDLSNYAIKIKSNGVGVFEGSIPLSGMLENNKSYIIVNNGAYGSADQELIDMESQIVPLNFNGNDAIALFHNNIMIDVIGKTDTSEDWGKDVTLTRTAGNPSIVFDLSEWVSKPIDFFKAFKKYTFVTPEPATQIGKYTTSTNHYEVTNLDPSKSYYYIVTDGIHTTDNIVHFRTEDLEAPVTLDALNIYRSQFDANWEAVQGAESYLFNLSEVSGPGFKNEVTDFTGVGDKGTPLPYGWTGTASGNYTTDASVGAAAPSIALKKDGEYIETRAFEYPIINLKFMYRFPSSGAGNILKIEGKYGNTWKIIDNIAFLNTAKVYPEYNFNANDNITALRFTFKKSSGNLSIDDVEITSGLETVIPVITDKSINDITYTPTGLKPLTKYMYTLRSYHHAYTSEYSEPIYVSTTDKYPASINDIKKSSAIKVHYSDGLIKIDAGELTINQVSLFSISGQCLYTNNCSDTSHEFSFASKGAYLINVITGSEHQTIKIIL